MPDQAPASLPPRLSKFAEREIRIRVAVLNPQGVQVATQFARLVPIDPIPGEPGLQNVGAARQLRALIPPVDGIGPEWLVAFGGRKFKVTQAATKNTSVRLTLEQI